MSGNWTCDTCGEPVIFRAPVGRWDMKTIACPHQCGGKAYWHEIQLTELPKQDVPVIVALHVEQAVANTGFQQMRQAAEKAGL